MINSVRWRGCRRVASVVLSYLLACTGSWTLFGQQEVTNIEIFVQSGVDRVNSEVGNWEIAVQVQDNRGRKLRGAAVVFQLNPGAGVFPGGSSILTLVTDSDGRAVARGFRRGAFAGPIQIKITATYGGLSAAAVVNQVNPKLSFMETPKKWWLFGGSAGVMAGVGVWLGTRTTTSPTRVTLGAGSVTPASNGR